MPWIVSVITSASVPPKQMSEIASVRKRIMRDTYVESSRPRTWYVCGRSSIWMKKRAAMAGMIMLASISASERSPAATMRKRRL